MDPFDDLFAPAATHARAVGKFQPKVKHRPKKQTLASAPSVVPNDTKEKTSGLSSLSSDAGQLDLSAAVPDDRSIDDRSNIKNSLGVSSLGVNGVEQSLKNCEDSFSGVLEGVISEKPSSEVGGAKEDHGSVDVFHQVGGVETIEAVPEAVDGRSVSRAPESEVGLVGFDVGHLVDSVAKPVLSSARVSSEQEKVVRLPNNGLDVEASVQPDGVEKTATKVNSMQFDVDPFDNILSASAASNTRAGLKFRPKMKPQPRKEAIGGVASALPNMIEQPVTLPAVDSVQSVQSVDTRNSTLTKCIDSSLAMSDILVTKEPPKNDGFPDSNVSTNGNIRSSEVDNPSASHATDALQSEVFVPDETGDWHSSFGRSLGENVDIFSGLEYLDPFISQTTTGTEMETRPVENFSAPAHGSFEASTFTVCEVAPSQTRSDHHSMQDPATSCAVSDKHEKVQINNERSETKVPGTLFDFETCEATVSSGKRAGKFQPRPIFGKGKAKPGANSPQAEVTSALPSEAVHFVPLDNGHLQEGSISEFPHEDVLDHSSARFSDSTTLGPTPGIQGNTEPTNLTEATQSDGTTFGDLHSEDDPGVQGKDGKSRIEEASTEPNHHRKNKKTCKVSEGFEGQKSSMQLRKRLRRFVDEPVDEADNANDSTYELPSTSNTDEEEDNDDEYKVDSTSGKKKAPRKVKEPVLGNEKPSRKRKNAKEAANVSTKKPPKKFSHSTRRSKRRVDKTLLDTPEDEIDPQRLPIKDLILLAEHRERIAIKDAAKLKTSQTNQSPKDSFRDDASYNEETFVSEQGQCSDDEHQASYKVQPSTSYVNYQSFMEKTPSTRWSKQDTELFYEAVRQFGTDFSLIQQLFPGRTRNQVKLKFKKEERQHPLQLSEAVTNRAKDHSHFESVIERLQQVASQAKQEADGNESIAVMGEEEVEKPADDTNEEAAKSERENEAAKDQEAVDAEVHNSPLKLDEIDDDPDRWSHYNY